MAAPFISPPLYATPADLWRAALTELQLQMTKATFNAWLIDSRVLAPVSTLTCLIISVRNRYAQEWLTHRLRPVIVRTLSSIAGYSVEVYVVYDNYAKEIIMNPLEDHLCQHLSQFDNEPEMAPSLKRNAYLEQTLIQAGIMPTSPVEVPANITPELLNNLLNQGDEPMTDQSNFTRVRIYSHITQSRFLHVEDCLAIGKLRLFGGNYRKGAGMTAYANAFVNIADARIILGALAGGEQGFSHKEYKGTPPRNGRPAVSRVLSIAVKDENVYIELKTGPGKLTNTGAITPNGKPEVEVNVGFKLYEARRMAASVLAYIHAWDVLRMMVNQQMIGQPSPYLLVPVASAANGIQVVQANGASKPNDATSPPVLAAKGRPVTRKDPVPKANGSMVKRSNDQPVRPAAPAKTPPAKLDTARTVYLDKPGTGPAEAAVSPKQPLQYGDGSMVDMQNLTEVQTFQRYVTEMKDSPKSKAVLLDYYRKGVQATTITAGQQTAV